MINGTGTGVGNTLSAHPDVDMISFTGSTRTELGGKSAAVMLDDADLPKLMPQFMGQLMNNTGQSWQRPEPHAGPEGEVRGGRADREDRCRGDAGGPVQQ